MPRSHVPVDGPVRFGVIEYEVVLERVQPMAGVLNGKVERRS